MIRRNLALIVFCVCSFAAILLIFFMSQSYEQVTLTAPVQSAAKVTAPSVKVPPEIEELKQEFAAKAPGDDVFRKLTLYRGPAFVEFLQGLLDHRNPEVRMEAVQRFVSLRASSAIGKLARLLLDKDEDVSDAARMALWGLPRKTVVAHLHTLAEDFDRNPHAATHAARLFGRFKDIDSTEHLVKWLSRDNEELREAAAYALSEIEPVGMPAGLLALLDSKSPEIRAAAVNAVGNMHFTESLEQILNFSHDTSAIVRLQVADVLGKFKGVSARDALYELSGDPDSEVRKKALWSIINFGDKTFAPRILQFLTDKDEDIANTASWVLGSLGNVEIISELSSLADHENSRVRLRVANVLGSLAAKEGLPLLIKLLDDKDPLVRFSSIHGIGEVADQSVVDKLYPLMLDLDSQVRRQLAETLGTLRVRSSAYKVVRMLQDHNPNVQTEASKALLSIRNTTITPNLIGLLHDPSTMETAKWLLMVLADDKTVRRLLSSLRSDQIALRRAAAEILSIIATKEDAPALAPFLRSEDPRIRAFAARTLSWLGAVEYADEIASLLKDENESVRAVAAEALGELKAKSVVKQLVELVTDESARMRSLTVWALGEIGDGNAISAVLKATRDKDLEVQRAAARALGEFGGEEALKRLLELVRDPEDAVRYEAAKAMAKIGGKVLEKELRRLLSDSSSLVQGAAIEGLAELNLSDPRLAGLIAGDSYGVRDAARNALIKLKNTKLTKSVLKHFSHEDSSVRDAAVEVVIKSGVASVVGELLELLDSDFAGARAASARALGKFPSPEASRRLVRALDDVYEKVFQAAQASLVETRAVGAVPAVIKLSRSDDPLQRQAAAQILGTAGTEKAGETVVNMLSDPDSLVREEALAAIARLKYEPALAHLLRLLTDRKISEIELSLTITAIGSIGSSRDVQQVVPFLKHKYSGVRGAAINALGEIGAPGTARYLLPLVLDVTVCTETASALVKLGDRSVTPDLEKLINARDYWVRDYAVKIIGEMYAKDSVEKILPLLRDSQPSVRYSVIEALGRIGTREHIPLIIKHIRDSSSIMA